MARQLPKRRRGSEPLVALHFKVPREVREMAGEAAAEAGLSQSAWIVRAMVDARRLELAVRRSDARRGTAR